MTRALVYSTLISSCLALGQGISTKSAYLPSDLVAQLKSDLAGDYDCPALSESIATIWLRLSKNGPLAVRVDGRGCLAGVTNGRIFLYARSENVWHKVLDTQGVRTSSLPTRSQGWRDLDVVQHVDAFISTHLIFRFDGLGYKPADCVEVDNTSGGPPRLKSHTCSFDWKVNGR